MYRGRYYALGAWNYYWTQVLDVVFFPSPHWLNYEPFVLLYRSLVFQVSTALFSADNEVSHLTPLVMTGRRLPLQSLKCVVGTKNVCNRAMFRL